MQKLLKYVFLVLAACAGFICVTLCFFTGETGKHAKYKEVIFEDKDRTRNPDLILSKRTEKEFNYQAEVSEFNNRQTAADDPRLVALIRDYFVIPPSNQPYQLDCAECLDQSGGQAPFVDNRLKYKENGFYVESGAYDGETMSNTLMLERLRRWAGVLIEPNPTAFEILKKKQRKTYAINACLSTEPYPSQKLLTDESLQSRIVHKQSFAGQKPNVKFFRSQCFPLYSILLALNVTVVDYLSLDVEGAEQAVLETIPWHKIHIDMLSIEYDKWPGGSRSLCKYMEYKGYECLLTMSGKLISDAMFQKTLTRRKGSNGRSHTRNGFKKIIFSHQMDN